MDWIVNLPIVDRLLRWLESRGFRPLWQFPYTGYRFPRPELVPTPCRDLPSDLTTSNQIFAFLCDFKTHNDGNAPTMREMMGATDASSTSVVNYHLLKLEQRGLISRPINRQSRLIRVIGGRWSYHPPLGRRDARKQRFQVGY
jgi:hypothetical protein